MSEAPPLRNACELCRSRKYKCNRKNPCSSCTRYSVECTYEPRLSKPRGRAGGRKPREKHLQDRLSRIESILSNVQATVQSQLSLGDDSGTVPSVNMNIDAKSPLLVGSSELSIHSTSSFWSSLTSEIGRLHDTLLANSDSILEGELEPETGLDTGAQPILYGINQTVDSIDNCTILPLALKESTVSEKGQHPSLSTRHTLVDLFLQYVDPVFKVTHAPSLRRQLSRLSLGPGLISEDVHTSLMLFAVYSAAVMSITEEQCQNLLQIGRKSALERFCLATETYLTQVDYLNTQSLNTIQAFTIYVLVLRSLDNGQRHWALIALALRLARGMGLHRKDAGRRKSYFEQEMRARVWHQLRILEFRAALDRGEEPELNESSYDIPGCLNFHDEDIFPEMSTPPQPRDEITACTFSVLSHDCVTLCKSLNSNASNNMGPNLHDEWRQKQQAVTRFVKMLETKVVTICVDANPLERYIKTVWQGLIPMCQLMVFRPIWQHSHLRPQPVEQGEILRLALASLQAENLAFSDTTLQPFVWYTWIQWYTLAVALAELCGQPDSEQSLAAWTIVERAYEHQSKLVADSASGKLWQPIKRLMRKAQSLRAWKDVQPEQTVLHDQPFNGQHQDVGHKEAHLSSIERQKATENDTEIHIQRRDDVKRDGPKDITMDDETWFLREDTITSDTMDDAWSFWQDFTKDLSELS